MGIFNAFFAFFADEGLGLLDSFLAELGHQGGLACDANFVQDRHLSGPRMWVG